jgi:hypothetical protein
LGFTASGSNLAITVWVAWFSDGSLPTGVTVTYDPGGAAQAMTQIGSVSVTNGIGRLYGLVAPGTIGAGKTVQISWTNSASVAAVACAWTGVNQTGGVTSFANYTSAAGNSVTVTSTANDVAIGEFVTTASMTSTNQTQLYVENSFVGSAANYAIGGVNPAMTVTGSGTIFSQGVSIKASGAAAPALCSIASMGAGKC